MVSLNTLRSHDFKTLERYFEYIVESKINGQHQQVIDLIKALSKEQKKELLGYLETWDLHEDAVWCKEKTIELL